VLTIFDGVVFTLFEVHFPFQFPRAVGENGKRKWVRDGRSASRAGARTTARSRLGSEPVTFGTALDVTRVSQRGEALVQGSVADVAQRA
jgi:hypothetical protein